MSSLLRASLLLLACLSVSHSHDAQKRASEIVPVGEAENIALLYVPYYGARRDNQKQRKLGRNNVLNKTRTSTNNRVAKASKLFEGTIDGFYDACEVTIISTYFAITSAEDVSYYAAEVEWPAFASYIIADTLDQTYDYFGNIYRVEQFYVNPAYDVEYEDYGNIALIRVCHPFAVSSFPVLADAEGTFTAGASAYTYTWNGHYSALVKVTLDLVDSYDLNLCEADVLLGTDFVCLEPTVDALECSLEYGASLYSTDDNKLYAINTNYRCDNVGAAFVKLWPFWNWIDSVIYPDK